MEQQELTSFPKSIGQEKKETRGYYDYRSNRPFLAVAWFDRKYVYFITIMHKTETTEPCTIRRCNQDGLRLDELCPPLLPDYQYFMRGLTGVISWWDSIMLGGGQESGGRDIFHIC